MMKSLKQRYMETSKEAITRKSLKQRYMESSNEVIMMMNLKQIHLQSRKEVNTMKSVKQRYMESNKEVIMMMNKGKLCKRSMNLVINFCMASCMNYCMDARLGGQSGSAVLFPSAGGAGHWRPWVAPACWSFWSSSFATLSLMIKNLMNLEHGTIQVTKCKCKLKIK